MDRCRDKHSSGSRHCSRDRRDRSGLFRLGGNSLPVIGHRVHFGTFIWTVRWGLVPQSQAIAELEASEEFKREIKSDIDSISGDVADDSLQALSVPAVLSPIQTVDFELERELKAATPDL